jgi:hypothetical protein
MSDPTSRRTVLGALAGSAVVAQVSYELNAHRAAAAPRVTAVGANALDVRSFGAIGDGKTDDTIAIQRALDALAGPSIRSLFFPPGRYCVSQPLRTPKNLTSAEIYGASGYDGVRGPINSGLATSLKWVGARSPETAMVVFDQSSGVRWAGISLDCSYDAGYGMQFMSSDGETGSVKNIVENCSIHYAARDGIIVGEWGTPRAGPGGRQFFGNVFRNLTFYGCASSAIHVNEWNADQQLFDSVMVYFDDGRPAKACLNAFWFDHGGQWSLLINCQSGGMSVDPKIPAAGFMIRNQASDGTTGGAFGLTVINAWQEGGGGLYYGVTSINDNKGFTFIGCASFTSDARYPSVFIDKGTSTRIAYTFISCSFASDVKVATPAVARRDIELVNCSFAPQHGLVDAGGRRTINGVFTLDRTDAGTIVIPAATETMFCTLTRAVRRFDLAGVPGPGTQLTAVLTQDRAGHRTIDWSASGAFTASPPIPQPNPAPGMKSVFTFVSDGAALILTSYSAGLSAE